MSDDPTNAAATGILATHHQCGGTGDWCACGYLYPCRERVVAETMLRYRDALQRIVDLPSGAIPGHSVAVGCRHNVVAEKALTEPRARECVACDGIGYTVDYGPWSSAREDSWRDEGGIAWGKRTACDHCVDGWWLAE